MKRTMRKLLLAAVLTLSAQLSYAQGTSATALTHSIEDYFLTPPTLATYSLVTPGSALTATTCATNLTDVCWVRFTVPVSAVTCSVKLTVNPTGFDAVVDLYDNSLTFLQCSNTAGSGASEILRSNPNTPNFVTIVPGSTYFVRITSTTDVTGNAFTFGAEYYIAGQLRPTYSPNPQFDDAVPGYKMGDVMFRVFNGTGDPFVEATEWRITDASNPSDLGCTFLINGTLSQVTVRNLPCVCFGRTYNVQVQLRIDGHWTGGCVVRQIVTETQPLTNIIGTPCAVIPLNGGLNTPLIGSAAILQWEITANGQTITPPASATVGTQLIFGNVPCLRYNRAYTARVRAQWCGIWGPWSSPYCFLTPPIPFTQLLVGQCGATVGRFTQFRCTPVPGASQYIWQFAEINPGDIQNPIAPAGVTCSIGEFTGAAQFLQQGKTYRVGVKPVLPSSTTACNNVFSTCTSYQQGDFGIFCQVTISGSLMPEYEVQADEIFTAPTSNDTERVLWVGTSSSPQRSVNINFTGKEVAGNASLRVFNMNGQIVHTEKLADIHSDAMYEVALPGNLSPGMYLLSVETGTDLYTDKFVISQ
jgi:hypothetical protein